MPALKVDLQLFQPVDLSVDFSVSAGEILAIVGRSGAGKSSLLKALAGLLPAKGRLEVAGDNLLDSVDFIPAYKRSIGFVFQGYALFPHLTILQNILLAMGNQADPVEAMTWLESVHLSGFENRKPSQLSGGQQQRVALARALARKPKLLLLDEPFSAVDRPTRRALAQTLLALRDRLKMPVIIVSHDIEDVALVADRIAILENGRICQIGPTAEVMENPASASIAELVSR